MDADIKSRGCEITLTCRTTGKSMTITLNHNHSRWIIKFKLYQGYHNELEPAVNDVLRRLKGRKQ